jgi:predicted ATPase
VCELLAQVRGSRRLVTLVGPGGVGKTRLAMAVSHAAQARFSDGAAFVELAGLRDDRLLPAAVGRSLELRESNGRSARTQLVSYLASRELLLVLDNLEQLPGAAGFVSELLEGCSRLIVLATSRSPLRLQRERRFQVNPLSVPAVLDGASLQIVSLSPAVQLFVERAQSVASDFLLTPANAASVAALCRYLDGLPLALELAAARAAAISPAELLGRLTRRESIPERAQRGLPARQASLRATQAWSHDLLSQPERTLFRRLSVFAGGWTLGAAEEVCSFSDLSSEDVVEHHEALVEHSLIQRTDDGRNSMRFRMLETVREYAAEQLTNSQDLLTARTRHVNYYTSLAELARPLHYVARVVAQLDYEVDNLRAALSWCRDHGEIERGLRLIHALGTVWYVCGSFSEGRSWAEQFLERTSSSTSARGRAGALMVAGQTARSQGDLDVAENWLIQAQELLTEHVDDNLQLGICLQFRGNIARVRGDYGLATELYERRADLGHQSGDGIGEGLGAYFLGLVRLHQEQPTQAVDLIQKALGLFRRFDHGWGVTPALLAMGEARWLLGDYAGAHDLLLQVIATYRQRGDWQGQGLAYALIALGSVARSLDQVEVARSAVRDGFQTAVQQGEQLTIADALCAAASFACSENPDQAVRLVSGAAALRTARGVPGHVAEQRLPAGPELARLRELLDERAFARAWQDGQLASADALIAEAIAALTAPSAGR